MILISHRGNIDGKYPEQENNPKYIDEAIQLGYDVEIDIWYVDGKLLLGHDNPQYEVDFQWFRDRISKLWVHCKNIESLVYFKDCGYNINYFWHQEDDIALTSLGYIWAYPGRSTIKSRIAVLPELHNEDVTDCFGVCSDYIKIYEK
jgi:hypothetical protein